MRGLSAERSEHEGIVQLQEKARRFWRSNYKRASRRWSRRSGRIFRAEFFPWYNHKHHHSGLGYLTPYEAHYRLAANRREQRAEVLKQAS